MRSCSDMPYHIGLTVKLHLSDKQKRLVAVNDGAQRAVYNYLVAANNDLYRMRQVAICVPAYRVHIAYLEDTAFSSAGIKAALPYLNSADIDCQTVENGRRNYRAAWKNMKERHAGVPVFHKKSYEQHYQTNCHYTKYSTGIHDGNVRFDGMSHLYLPKLGRVRIGASPKLLASVLRNPQDRRIGTVTISRDAVGEYWCSLQIASEHPFYVTLPKTGRQIGIDLNILELANGSDGVSFENKRFAKAASSDLAHKQHVLSRKAVRAKSEGRSLYASRNYQKQRIKTAAASRRVSRQRDNYLNCVSKALVENQDLIAAENLQVRNLFRNHKLAYAISDCSWRMLLTQLQQKAAVYGRECVLVPPHFTTQTCSACGHVMRGEQALPLSVREWTCPECGTYHLRDQNAGQNILAKAVKMRLAV